MNTNKKEKEKIEKRLKEIQNMIKDIQEKYRYQRADKILKRINRAKNKHLVINNILDEIEKEWKYKWEWLNDR